MNQGAYLGPLGKPGHQAGASQRPRAGLEAPGPSAVGQAGAQLRGVHAFETAAHRGPDTGAPRRRPRLLFPLVSLLTLSLHHCVSGRPCLWGRVASDPPVSSVWCPQRHLACWGEDGAVILRVFLLSPQGFYDFSPEASKREL